MDRLPFPFDRPDGPDRETDRTIGRLPYTAITALYITLGAAAGQLAADVGGEPARAVALVPVAVLVYRSAVRLREVWRHNRPPVARGFVPGAFGICETCNEEVPVYESVTGRYVCGANPEHGLLLADYNGRLLADQARRTPKGGHHGLAH